MKAWTTLAVVFISVATATTTAMGQKIYRCGSEYSQVPCSDAVVVEANDPRSSAQKVQSDAMIQRNAAAARTMEKTRLEQEAALRSTAAASNASSKKKKHSAKQHTANTTTAAQPGATDEANEGKKMKKGSKKKESAYFTARSTPTPKKDKSLPKG
jgi:G3E family GTPase